MALGTLSRQSYNYCIGVGIVEVVLGIVFSVIFFLFFLQNKAGAGAEPAQEARPSAPRMMDATALRTSGERLDAISQPHLPQDSTLRRHYVTHIRQMVEDLAGPAPSDSVLRRHHEHLVVSRVDECVDSCSRLQALNEQFDAYRKTAV